MSEKPKNESSSTVEKNWEEVSNKPDEEISPSEDKAAVSLEATQGSQAELAEELEVAQTEAKRNYELFLRTQAEMVNYKKRAQKDLENAHKYGIKKLVEDLVPVLDGLEQGLQTELDLENDTLKQMHTGLQLTYNMLLDTMKKYGIVQLDPQGEVFNPEHHEAMSMVEDENHESNQVLTVFQKGYLLNGRILRPARVIVAK